MKLKKISALALGLMLAVSAVGCGESSSGNGTSAVAEKESQTKADDTELKIWVPEEEVELTDQMVKTFDDIHDEFDINYEIAVVGIDEAPQALETDADTAADIFYTPSGGVGDLVSKGLLLPITKDFDTLACNLLQRLLIEIDICSCVEQFTQSHNLIHLLLKVLGI